MLVIEIRNDVKKRAPIYPIVNVNLLPLLKIKYVTLNDSDDGGRTFL